MDLISLLQDAMRKGDSSDSIPALIQQLSTSLSHFSSSTNDGDKLKLLDEQGVLLWNEAVRSSTTVHHREKFSPATLVEGNKNPISNWNDSLLSSRFGGRDD